MQSYMNGGGRIAFMGEHGVYAPNENNRIAAGIAGLGGHISIINDYPDAGVRDATKLDGQIKVHPLTNGVNIYNYACFAPLQFTGAGPVTLMTGEEHPTDIMMGFENIGAGSIFLITDQNVWDNVYSASNDNDVMFLNLISASTAVPLPSTVYLLGSGLLSLAGWRRFRKS